MIVKRLFESENKFANIRIDKYMNLPDHIHFVFVFEGDHTGFAPTRERAAAKRFNGKKLHKNVGASSHARPKITCHLGFFGQAQRPAPATL